MIRHLGAIIVAGCALDGIFELAGIANLDFGTKALFALGCVGIVGAIGWHLIAPDKALQPTHFIAVGILIAVAGIAWQFLRLDPSDKSTELQQQIDTLKRQLAEATKEKPVIASIPQANSNSQIEGSLPPKRYTPYEKEQRLRAIDELYNVFATKLLPASDEGTKAIQSVKLRAVDADAEDQLIQYSSHAEIAFAELTTLCKKYEYFSDIIQATKVNTFNGVAATNATKNLANQIRTWRQKMPDETAWAVRQDVVYLEANSAMEGFRQYIRDTMPRLQKKREEIEQTSIYSDK